MGGSKHVTKGMIKSAIKEFKKREHKSFDEIVKMDFPQLYQIFDAINVELAKVFDLLDKLFTAIDKGTDIFADQVDKGLTRLAEDLDMAMGFMFKGLGQLFAPFEFHPHKKPQLDAWMSAPKAIDFKELSQVVAPPQPHFNDFGLGDLNRVFGAPQFPRFGDFKLF